MCRSLRLTLRLRLTLLYGAVFIAAGAGLLAVTYVLFKQNQSAQSRTVAVRGVQFELPAGTAISLFTIGRPGNRKLAAVPPKNRFTTRPPSGSGAPAAGPCQPA